MTQPFSLTSRQVAANAVLGGPAKHAMLYGGSRSGKTFLLCRAIATRALKAPKSRHGVFRFHFNHVKTSIILDTWPKMMSLCFPGVRAHVNSDFFAPFPNGSEVWFGGLDDKERTEKVLGQEFATLFFNECSQIPFASREMAVTRLAQRVEQYIDGSPAGLLVPRAYYDENPPDKSHWTYRLFELKVDPETKRPLSNPDDFVSFRINPEDNRDNLSADYLQTLQGLSARMQKRFLRGEFRDANPNALFPEANIDRWRVTDGTYPELVRIVVAVDPSGSGDTDNADNDAIGIVVIGLASDGNAYLLEDLTVKAGPATWGAIVVSAYQRHEADVIVAETNYGGEMVGFVVKAAAEKAKSRVNFRKITASRGKVVRAEPVSALNETGKVRFVGYFPELEDELSGFTTSGYVGGASPNRADAYVWGVSELFPGMTTKPAKEVDVALYNPSPSALV